jgi:RNA polymerase sigma-70 factor (ECF subfamily)
MPQIFSPYEAVGDPRPPTPNRAVRSSGDEGNEEEFIRLLARSYRSIYSYAQTLVPNLADAEDCVQEVSLLMWRKFDEFGRDGNFSRWARGFVRRVAKNHNRKKRPHYLALDDDLIDKLGAMQGGIHEILELRRVQLAECLTKLPAADWRLINDYYQHGESVEELSRRTGRTPAALYQALRRARLALFRCVSQNLGVL